MAGENEVDVDIGVGSNELDAQLRRTFEAMRAGLQAAQSMQVLFENTAARARELPGHIANLNKELASAQKSGDTGQIKKINDQITASIENQKKFNDELREEARLQKELNLARGAGRRVGDQATLADGRTAGQARNAESALRDAITGINTSSDQIAARLALATGKAMERMLGATADAMEKSFQVAQQRQMSRNAQLSVPGYLDARVTNDRVTAERAVAAAGRGATLAEREANARERANAEDENRQRTLAANRIRREAERENAEFDRARADAAKGIRRQAEEENATRDAQYRRMRAMADWDNRNFDIRQKASDAEYRAADTKMRSDAAYEDRQRTLAANRMRRDAERENKERDAAARGEALGTYNSAADENRARDAAYRRQRTMADWDNRNFDMRRKASDAEYKAADTKMRAEAAYEDRQRTLAANRIRREAERENRERTAAIRATPEAIAGRSFEVQQARFDLNGGADQFKMQAQLAANYAMFGVITTAITGTLSALVQFDEGLKQFQAITGTTNKEMETFRGNLLGIAASSKFSVNEITQVAIALGQTGLAASGVEKALKPVMDLAAASGSTLQQSVEAITAVLGAYGMEASRAGDVADVFVAALNRTKLTMEQLQLGIQYAANIARDSGVSFSELTASIGAIAQAGVKSGSTIGTGIRQLITELSAPTEKLRGVLKELGISLDDVDLRTQGFTTVLTTLQAKGFGTAEALRALDLRAAAAFSALAGQSSKIALLEQEFLLTSSAVEAAAKANESFSASGQRLLNTIFSIVDKGFRPLIEVMALGTGGVASLLKGLNEYGTSLPLIAAGLSSVAAAAAAIKITNLLGGFVGLGGAALIGAGATLPVAGALAAGGSLVYYLSQIQTEADKARTRIDELKAVENDLMARQQSVQTNTSDIDKRIQTLIDRRDRLNTDPVLARNAVIDAQKAFGDLGLVIEGGSNSIEGLITALQKLRGEMNQEMPQVLAQQLESINQQIIQLQKLQEIEERRRQGEGKRTLNVAEVALGATPVFSDGKMADYARLGPEFAEVAAYLTGQNRIDPADARGSTAGLTQRIYSQLQGLRSARNEATLDTEMAPRDRRSLLDALDARIKVVEEAFTALTERVAKAANEQALRVRAEVKQGELDAAAIQGTPEFKALKEARERIYGQQDAAIRNASTGPAREGVFEDMQAAMRSTDEVVRQKLAEIEEAKKAALADGKTKEGVDQAFQGLTDAFNTLLKGSTKEIRDRFVALTPAVRAQLQAEIRTGEGQLSLIARQAAQSRDASRVGEFEALAKSIQAEVTAAREKLFKIEQGPNAEAVIEASPELREKREELRQQGRDRLAQLGLTYAEIHRRLQDQLLSFRVEGEQERKSLIDAQIRGLEKVRDDVRSTPEQMRAAVLEINRLLGEVAKIGQSLNSLNSDKDALRVPQGPIGPTAKFEGGSVQQGIIDSLRAAGADEARIRYALASGQVESGYAPDVISGARRSSTGATGLFQFMPSTWNKMYGTPNVSTDIADQLRAFQDLTNRNAGSFQSNMGRSASSEELYLMHQQGAAGAMALLRAGNSSALDALAGVYGNRNTASTAITANGGRVDMQADEFVQIILRKFRKAANEVGNPFGTSGEAEIKRRRQVADDKTAEDAENARSENERREAANLRARELTRLRKLDAAESENYGVQTAAIRRALTPDEARSANQAATESLRKLFDLANSQDDNRPDRQDEAGRAEAREARRKQFSATAQDQALAAADAVGRSQLKQFTDLIARLEAEKKELERPENAAKEGNAARLDMLNEELNLVTKRKELEGEYAANQQRLLTLEQALRDIEAAGLGDASKQLQIQARIAELKDRQRQLDPLRQVADKQAEKQNTYGGAFELGVRDTLRSRGIMNEFGGVIDETVRARRTITESLNVIGGAFDNFFTNLFSGSMKAGDALKKFATDILGGLMSSISKSLTNSIFQSIFTGGNDGGGIVSMISSLVSTGMYTGGPIRMAGGGSVPGRDAALAARDSRLILAQPEEYLLRKSAVDAIGRDNLDQMNALGGRMVARAPQIPTGSKLGSSATAATSVYVVDRDQVPVPGPNEIVYAVGENIQRGGSMRQLIKEVVARG